MLFSTLRWTRLTLFSPDSIRISPEEGVCVFGVGLSAATSCRRKAAKVLILASHYKALTEEASHPEPIGDLKRSFFFSNSLEFLVKNTSSDTVQRLTARNTA